MRYRLLDVINSPVTKGEFRVADPQTKSLDAPAEVNAIPCRYFCGFKSCKICDDVSLQDCRKCAHLDILSGTLTSSAGDRFQIVDGRPSIATRVLEDHQEFRIVETDFRRDPRLRPFLAQRPDSLIFHSPEWMQALSDEYGQQSTTLAAESEDDEIIGILPLFYTRGLPFHIGRHQTGKRLCSLPRTPIAGPIAQTPEVISKLVKAAIQVASERPGMKLQLKCQDHLPEVEDSTLFCTEWRPTYVLQMSGPGEKLTFGNAKNRHNLKWAVNKAIKLGLQVRPAQNKDELRRWYILYLDVMRRNLCPPRPFRFFESLWDQLAADSKFQLLLAERNTDSSSELIAGSVFLKFGSWVSYAFTGCMTGNLVTHANDLILWEAIHESADQGFKYFDFGECPEEHPELIRFKTKWGAIPTKLYRYYPAHHAIQHSQFEEFNPGMSRHILEFIWHNVPLRATAFVGDLLYKWL